MITLLLTATALLCGVPLGFIIGLLMAMRIYDKAGKPDEFDGGFEANNPPPRVHTTIWLGDGDR